MSNTPTLDRMLEIQEQSQLCGEFLEWLQSKYSMYDKKIKRESPFIDVMRDTGDYINTEKLLAEFFDIDLEEADKEKSMLLEAERNMLSIEYILIRICYMFIFMMIGIQFRKKMLKL